MICSYGIYNRKIISISRFCSLRALLREGRTEQGDTWKHIVKTKDRKKCSQLQDTGLRGEKHLDYKR